MSLSQTCVAKLYAGVIEEVIGGVREFFMDEGVDEQVLMELKHTWETRLQATKAVEVKQDTEPQPPTLKNVKPNTTAFIPSSGTGQATGIPLDITKNVSLQITLPPQQGTPDQPRTITIQVPGSALQGNQIHTLLSGPVVSATMALPQHLAASLLQQHVTSSLQGHAGGVLQMQAANNGIQNAPDSTNRQLFQQQVRFPNNIQTTGDVTQLDGPNDTSDDDEEEDEEEEEAEEEDDAEDDDKEDEENEDVDGGAEEEPLNSGDDVSEEDPTELFETDNVVVCQYDKITRSRNKWKFYLKDGIMNLGGKDYVFQKSNGDAEW